ncbi:TPA: hypothetical protein ACKQBZ_003754, partial [Stenotrophomonas maltophilia]
GAIHGANAPAWLTRPASDSFRACPATEERKKEEQERVARCARSSVEPGHARLLFNEMTGTPRCARWPSIGSALQQLA